jgi:IrrE N-terminal-like domain
MTLSLLRIYEETLRRNADWLTGEARGSVDVLGVCARLGVGMTRSPHVTRAHARIANSGGKPTILLAADASSQSLSSWDRFLVGHELGHFILYTEHNAKPLGKSEYWKHEALCDAFARWLLVPATALQEKLNLAPSDAISRLAFSCELADEARIPWPAAALAICDRVGGLAFFRVGDLRRSRLKVDFSTLPAKKGIHTRIDQESPAGRALVAIQAGSPARGLDGGALGDILWSEGQTWAALRVGDRELRIAGKS